MFIRSLLKQPMSISGRRFFLPWDCRWIEKVKQEESAQKIVITNFGRGRQRPMKGEPVQAELPETSREKR